MGRPVPPGEKLVGGHADPQEVPELLILPAIDLRGGKCVRLIQGDYGRETVYGDDAASVAREFERDGGDVIHVVDLDAAKTGELTNLDIVASIVKSVGIPVEVGGGIRSMESAAAVLETGAARVICGTALVKEPGLAEALFDKYGERIVAGIDAREGMAAVAGWIDQSDVSAVDLAKSMEAKGCRRIILTDIARDGMLNGPNLDLLAEVAKAVSIPVIQSGGVGSLDHVRQIAEHGVAEGVIIGRAIYEGKLTVAEARGLVAR
jgi:phosphoribosylformimino-5-aminoimidazole carboxamide ribotide isomerase